MKTFGTRAEVFHGAASKTAGGLTKKQLFQDDKSGRSKSKGASCAALLRMKSEGDKHLVKVFKPIDGKFKKQPKSGTKTYKKLVKKML